MGTEFKAVYDVSRQIANLTDPVAIRVRLLSCARELVPLDGAAVVMADRAQTRYVVENAEGWASEFEGREVGLLERTWTAWLLKSDEPSLLLDDLQGGRERMPVLVLDEGGARAESLLAVALRTQQKTLGALMLTGKRGTFDSAVPARAHHPGQPGGGRAARGTDDRPRARARPSTTRSPGSTTGAPSTNRSSARSRGRTARAGASRCCSWTSTTSRSSTTPTAIPRATPPSATPPSS